MPDTPSDTATHEILIFGAGNIGRSFVGQIFGRAGYATVFADVDGALVHALTRDGTYTVVHRHPDGHEERLTVPHVSAVRADDPTAVNAVLRRVRLVATSVGAAVLPKILPLLAEEAVRRYTHGQAPFDLILAENIHGGGEMARQAILAQFPTDSSHVHYKGSVPCGGAPGVIECSVGKMVPIIPEALRRREPTTVYAEAFNTLLVDAKGWSGPLPEVTQIRAVQPIQAWVERKLYIHNLGHAASAYLGHLYVPHLTSIAEVISEASVHQEVRTAMETAGVALQYEYPGVFSDHDITGHIEDLLYRFASPTLGDTVFRVGRDIRRKLGAHDRIAGALHLLRRHNLPTAPLERVYRAALHFRARDEAGNLYPADEQFHNELQSHPDPTTYIAELSDFDPRTDRPLLNRLVENR
ncbi:MAG TPA: mannitol-1-phosphate 5-dehydrogenase [Alkalispirochaeta sp.]|nr:mannitol-1-phosphate 5-dehydrogenase [Alkalispirochaeta sp.]